MTAALLEEFIKTHHRETFLWARQCCDFDSQLAEDVLQQSYLKVLEGKAMFNEQSSPKTWLFSVIRFTALEWLRKNHKEIPLRSDFDLEDMEHIPEAATHEELIQRLPDRQKEILLLVFYHQMTLEKAADVMEVSVGTARTHYDRGKKKLKELILKKQSYEETR